MFTTKRSKGAYAYSFDSDTKTACADNCANCHIWNDLEDFENYRELKPKERNISIETVGDASKPIGIGTVKTGWKDDKDKYHHIWLLSNAYYMPDSPVKVLSVTCLANEFQDKYGNPDEEGTMIITKRSQSTLIWNHGRFRKTLYHQENLLPEIPLLDGYRSFMNYCHVADKKINPDISQKFCATSFNKKNLIEFKKASKPFAPNEKLIYINEGKRKPVKFKKCIMEKDKLKWCVESEGKTLFLDNGTCLKRKDYLDIADIPIRPAAYKKMLESLGPENCRGNCKT